MRFVWRGTTQGMNPNREELLFQLALMKPVGERAAWLDRECGEDRVLRVRLDALLAAHELPEPIIDMPVKATLKQRFSDHPPDEPIGEKIGRYRILEKVGEGGCGLVYVAEQTEPVRRRVALKVLKLGMDTRQVVARFEAERQALAMMDHLNIAKVFDAGSTETGRPYFSMEFVRGIRITDYCDQNNLSTKERLDLFINVCQALQHAHQKGIIHRDIKPSNILVTLNDGVPVPKVIDFGIAKATEGKLTDATVYTQLHQFIGTPAYMSPEQAEMSGLDIDTRSDIYSLGVLLYELLTGRTPFDAQELVSQGIDAMRKTIREQEPAPPSTKLATLQRNELTTTAKRRSVESSTLTRLLRGDLDWIVMTCLEKDRTRRYQTANDLAMDIQRHLNNEPIRARPPSSAYRLQKLVRRNRLAFASGAAVFTALLLGLMVSSWQAVRATRAERMQTQLREKSEAEARRAAEAEQQAKAEAERATKAEADAITKGETARQALAKSQLDLAEKEFERAKFVESQKILDETPENFRDANWRFLWANSRDFTAQLSIPDKGTVYQLLVLPQGDSFAAKVTGAIGVFTLAGQQVGEWIQAASPLSRDFGIDSSGEKLAFAASTNEVEVHELATGKLLRRWVSEIHELQHILLSPDGESVLAVGEDQIVAYAQTGARLWTHPCTAVLPAFSRDGQTLAIVASTSGPAVTIQILDPRTGSERSTLEASGDSFPLKTSLQFNESGDRLACLGGDELIVWNLTSSSIEQTLHFAGQTLILLNPRGDAVATMSGNRIHLYDATTGRCLRSFNGATTETRALTFSPDGNTLLSSHVSGRNAVVMSWPVRLGEEVVTGPLSSNNGRRVLFMRDGSRFYAAATSSAAAWDTRSGLQRWKYSPGHTLTHLAIHPEDGSVVLSEKDKPALTHYSAAGEALKDFGINENPRMEFSRNGHLLLAVADAFDLGQPTNSFSVMEYPPGKRLGGVSQLNSFQPYAAFCLDDSAVATAAKSGGLTVWDWKAGTPLRQITATQTWSIGCLAASLDEQYLATGSPDGWIRIWEAATGRLKSAFRAHWQSVSCVKFSPDGREILSGGEDGTVRVHDGLTGEQKLVLYGYTWPVEDVDFSLDGSMVAAIATDGLAKVWDRKSSSEVVAADPEAAPSDAVSPEEQLVRQGKFKEAVPEFVRIQQRNYHHSKPFLRLAALLVETGDTNAYRLQCHKALGYLGDKSSTAARHTSIACLLSPLAPADTQRAARLADRALSGNTDPKLQKEVWLGKGMAEYRLGNFAAALVWLEKAARVEKKDSHNLEPVTSAAFAVMASAQQQLKQPEKARTALAQAQTILKTARGTEAQLGANWHDILIAQALVREASQLAGVAGVAAAR
jgi:serine/threonine protein kinase/WD40 repeat protein